MRKQRIALIDPIDYVAYSRVVRKGSKYHEDASLQEILNDKGLEAAQEFASRRYHGVMVAVLAD